jgi:hypothetical protein
VSSAALLLATKSAPAELTLKTGDAPPKVLLAAVAADDDRRNVSASP